MSDPPEVREAWGAYAAAFAAEGEAAEKRESIRELVRLAGLPAGAIVLDVATGAGFTAFAFARAGCRLVALDPTHEMLLQTRTGWEARFGGEVPVVEAWAEALPFHEAVFDAVVSHRAPHQFDDVPAFLAEARRVLRAGGVLGIGDQSPFDGCGQWHNEVERLRDPTHRWALEQGDWVRVVEGAGFRVEATAVAGNPLDVDDWLGRVDCPPNRRAAVLDRLNAAPEPVRPRVATVEGQLRYDAPQLVLVARR